MPDHSMISALTIARGRRAHLGNQLRGWASQTRLPDEVVIAVMDDTPYDDLPNLPIPVRQVLVPRGDTLPLARARNIAAQKAQGDLLVFCDVDCIPHPSLVSDYAAAARRSPGLLMGEVLYLPDGATDKGVDIARFDRLGERHSDRRGPPEETEDPCNDYRCFWSLNFAMPRAGWDRVGGFDESFTGYGGEDTDFGRMCDARDVPIWWTKGARAYHQYHPHAMPPVHHLHSVLRNAERFADKWGHRTMEHWLYAFRLMGLIETNGTGLRVIREPDARDFALCEQQAHMSYASTRRVIDDLQGVTGKDREGAGRVAEVERAQAALLNRVAAE
ncbi:MAG: glycosyltransferase family 2 protein [Paracoccaceae bacterium]